MPSSFYVVVYVKGTIASLGLADVSDVLDGPVIANALLIASRLLADHNACDLDLVTC